MTRCHKSSSWLKPSTSSIRCPRSRGWFDASAANPRACVGKGGKRPCSARSISRHNTYLSKKSERLLHWKRPLPWINCPPSPPFATKRWKKRRFSHLAWIKILSFKTKRFCLVLNTPGQKKMNLLDANVSLFGHWGKIHRKKMARVFSFVVTH